MEIFHSGEVLAEWEESFILNLYKRKGEVLKHDNYHGLKFKDSHKT